MQNVLTQPHLPPTADRNAMIMSGLKWSGEYFTWFQQGFSDYMSHLGFTEMYKYTASYLSFYDLEKFSSILHHPQESTVIYFSDGIPTVFFLHLGCSHIINSHCEYLQLDVRYVFLAEIGKKQNQMY